MFAKEPILEKTQELVMPEFKSVQVSDKDKTQTVYLFQTPEKLLKSFLNQKKVFQNFMVVKNFLLKCFDYHCYDTSIYKQG